MTDQQMPAFQVHPTDPGNDYAVGMYPTSWVLSTAHLPIAHPEVLEQVLIITWRVGPSTVTVVLPQEAAQGFHADVSKRVRNMTSLVTSRNSGRPH
jgi:hypothetical protein